MKRDILMIVHTMGTLHPSDNDRYTYIANKLRKEGANVEIVTSDFEHHKKSYRDLSISSKHDFRITFLHEDFYKKNVSLQRIKAHISFAKRLQKYLETRRKPDIIYCAIPPTISAYVTAKYAKKNNIPFAIDIQDLWPESFYMVLGNNFVSRTMLKPIVKYANYVYESADYLFAVSETFLKRGKINNNKAKLCKSIFLGTDSKMVDSVLVANSIAKPEGEFWIGYAGNIGKSYDFEHLYPALKNLNERIRKKEKEEGRQRRIRFLLLGDGNYRTETEQLSRNYFPDTIFTGYLPYAEMMQYISKCDITVNPFVKKSASSIVNKVGDYAAAGIAVMNSLGSEEYIGLLKEYNAGLIADSENSIDMAEKLYELYINDEMRIEMGRNNRKLYEDYFDRNITYTELVYTLLNG